MSNPPTKATANTLGAVAKMYGVTLDVLINSWIVQHAELYQKIQPYRDGKKLVFPPAIIAEIFEKLGEP